LLRGILTAIVVVPAIGIVASFAAGLSLPEKVGIVLIAVAPGAPLALRRALGSGAHAGFAPTLQIAIALLAVPAVPSWVMVGNLIFGTQGNADPAAVARQVLLAQLLPLTLGAAMKRAAPVWADRAGAVLSRAGAVLLLAAIVFQIVDLHRLILSMQLWPVTVAAATTIAALSAGHLMGRGSPKIGHSIAVASALRNIGLAMLIATANQAPPLVEVTIVTYALTAIVVVSAYIVVWNRRFAGLEPPLEPPGAG
jgi:predicted Na+-dependent transporter